MTSTMNPVIIAPDRVMTRRAIQNPRLWRVLYLLLLQIALLPSVWVWLFHSGMPRAIDGSTHYAAALLYSQRVFPGTFGWTNAYFLGMPFPNYYPPLYFWVIGFLAHLGIPFPLAFNLVSFVPLLFLLPCVWLLCFRMRGRSAAFWGAMYAFVLLVFPPLNGARIWACGLDYLSTFVTGLYSEPIGAICLIAWYLKYRETKWTVGRCAIAGMLLAFTILSNFVSAIVAGILIASTLVVDLIAIKTRRKRIDLRDEGVRTLLGHIVVPIWAACLAAFWIAPAFGSYSFFVTRPFSFVPFTPAMVTFQIVGVASALLLFPRADLKTRPFLMTCVFLYAAVIVAGVAPSWFPFQANRITGILNLLLAVPIGMAGSELAQFLKRHVLALLAGSVLVRKGYFQLAGVAAGLTLMLLFGQSDAFGVYARVCKYIGFYPDDLMRTSPGVTAVGYVPSSSESYGAYEAARAIGGILNFGRQHRAGRYLVGIPAADDDAPPTFDAMSISAYLGAQGNESAFAAYREAAPNSIFLFPQVSAFSSDADPTPRFGISSTLADDLDFEKQPIDVHLSRIHWLGFQYLVIGDDRVKKKLNQSALIGGSESFGRWTVYRFASEAPPLAESLKYKPALVLSGFTAKERRSGDNGFLRLAEEQFASNWFDVPLVRSPITKIDDLTPGMLNNVGALILESYDFDEQGAAYDVIRKFSELHPVIMAPADQYLFHIARRNPELFPHAYILDGFAPNEGMMLNNVYGPRYTFANSTARNQWRKIQEILDANKEPVGEAGAIAVTRGEKSWDVRVGGSAETPLPVLIRAAYHPRWQSSNGTQLLPATPFVTVAFIKGSDALRFRRNALDLAGAGLSMLALAGAAGLWVRGWERRKRAAAWQVWTLKSAS